MLQTFLNPDVLAQVWPMLLRGLATTLLLIGAALILATALGVAAGLARRSGGPLLRGIASGWIALFRAMPVLVLLIVIVYALPHAGIRLPATGAAIVSLGLVHSAATADLLRAGMEAVPRGQVEAATAMGVPQPWITREIVVPQALRAALPLQAAQGVALAKDSALASVVAVPDLLQQGIQAQAAMANPSPLIAAALLYVAVLLMGLRLAGWLEQRAGP